jgi:exosome complex RNA-binding protein Rrp4
MDDLVDQVVLPGDKIGSISSTKTIRLGQGLWQDNETIIATKAGFLRSKGEKYWVENSQKRV